MEYGLPGGGLHDSSYIGVIGGFISYRIISHISEILNGFHEVLEAGSPNERCVSEFLTVFKNKRFRGRLILVTGVEISNLDHLSMLAWIV